jgi:hypothetical protein
MLEKIDQELARNQWRPRGRGIGYPGQFGIPGITNVGIVGIDSRLGGSGALLRTVWSEVIVPGYTISAFGKFPTLIYEDELAYSDNPVLFIGDIQTPTGSTFTDRQEIESMDQIPNILNTLKEEAIIKHSQREGYRGGY